MLEGNGWRVRRAADVTATPSAYRAYVRSSAGEFSCAKPSCMRLRNSWVSDRTICYLASGRPAVVQDTGPSESLDGGRGVLRFSTLEQAAEALASVRSDYEGHRSAAREVAETYFDARDVARRILDGALGPAPTPLGSPPVGLPGGGGRVRARLR
jgi:glycosyltransferase involved in cell wall biosynthesis